MDGLANKTARPGCGRGDQQRKTVRCRHAMRDYCASSVCIQWIRSRAAAGYTVYSVQGRGDAVGTFEIKSTHTAVRLLWAIRERRDLATTEALPMNHEAVDKAVASLQRPFQHGQRCPQTDAGDSCPCHWTARRLSRAHRVLRVASNSTNKRGYGAVRHSPASGL